jgi:hypothetical protein
MWRGAGMARWSFINKWIGLYQAAPPCGGAEKNTRGEICNEKISHKAEYACRVVDVGDLIGNRNGGVRTEFW